MTVIKRKSGQQNIAIIWDVYVLHTFSKFDFCYFFQQLFSSLYELKRFFLKKYLKNKKESNK